MSTYLKRHLQVLFATLGELGRTPLLSLNTIFIIGFSLALPTMLYIVVKSGEHLSQNLRGQQQITIFLEPNLNSDESRLIFEEISLHPHIAISEFVSKDQALEEFISLSGLEAEVAFLNENPLPPSIVILPIASKQTSHDLIELKGQLNKIDGIEDIRLDLAWTDRLNGILKLFAQGALFLSIVLGLSLLLIVGNSIKLLIMNRKQEIEITKLVGGSDRFVRRPFLYYGLLYGLLGSVVACLILIAGSFALANASSELADLYQKSSLIYKLSIKEIGFVLILGSFLGWLAARLSVAQHLNQIQPK